MAKPVESLGKAIVKPFVPKVKAPQATAEEKQLDTELKQEEALTTAQEQKRAASQARKSRGRMSLFGRVAEGLTNKLG